MNGLETQTQKMTEMVGIGASSTLLFVPRLFRSLDEQNFDQYNYIVIVIVVVVLWQNETVIK
jgi:hypothetical protein